MAPRRPATCYRTALRAMCRNSAERCGIPCFLCCSKRHQSLASPAAPLKYLPSRAEARLQPPAGALLSHAGTWPGRARSQFLIPVRRHAAVPPRSPRKWRQFRRSQPPKGRRGLIPGPRRTSLRWACQVPTNVATVSQIAAPQGRRGLKVVPVRRHSAGPPRNPRTWRQFRRSQPPKGIRGLIWTRVRRHSAGPPSSLRNRRQFRRSPVSQIAAPPPEW